ADWIAQRDRLRAELLRLDRDAPAMDGARGAIARAERAAPLVAARALADAAAAERGRRGVEAGERAAAGAACAGELERCRTAALAVPALKAQIDAWAAEETQLRELATVEREAQIAVRDAEAAAAAAVRLAAADASARAERDARLRARQAAEEAAAAPEGGQARARLAAEAPRGRRAPAAGAARGRAARDA